MWLSCAASLLQAGVAIALVSVLVHGLGWLTREALGSVVWVERASFLKVALLGAWLCWRALRQLRRTPSPTVPSRDATPVTATHESHRHHSACGCGHEHHVDPARTGDWRTALSTVVAIGIRPCSGGVLMLGAASLLGHFWVGVAAVLTMSAGTALAVTGLALASVLARDWATRRYASSAGAARLERVSGWAALCGGAVIMTLGISLSLAGASMPAMPLLGEPATPSPAASSHPFR
ncbi:hypothetical protein [Litchfieldella xinjiangensis]|uniref:nickel/cobalt transporter n=1 Tax=Litchfieldella xinjiangensis TaxID=1166948 RepID=UPI002F35A6B8